jgi:3-hydroxybutyryl-CoA dehydrogenase
MSGLPREAVVAVVGAGTMGSGIAQVAAHAGHAVLLHDAQPGAAEAAVARVDAALGKLVERGKLDANERAQIAARLRVAHDLANLAPAKLVIEAIVENADVKRDLFARLERIVAGDAILATNTSSLSISALAGGLSHPERFAGMHFFNPAPLMRLVEIVAGLATDPRVAETLADTARAWGKEPVQARSTPGFIVNRCARPFYGEALRMLQEGVADPATIDAVMREAGGFRMGPFELMDLIGHDVNFEVTRSMHAASHGDPRYQPSWIQQELVSAGRLGRKSGRGFYDYAEGAEKPSPATAPAAPPPHSVVVHGDLGPAAPLMELIARTGIAVTRVDDGALAPGRLAADATSATLEVDGVVVAPSDGRTATERAAAAARECVVFDLALDYAQAARIAIAPAAQASPRAVATAAGLFQALGKQVSIVGDGPGLVVLRTVSLLVNEAADAVHQGVCSARDLDTAMRIGVNYPRGPLAWAEALGLPYMLAVAENIARGYGEDRYRPAPLLRRLVLAGRRFHEEPAT